MQTFEDYVNRIADAESMTAMKAILSEMTDSGILDTLADNECVLLGSMVTMKRDDLAFERYADRQ